jgi:tRNA A-37 threonylcarbamoyl transferase component Bud32
MNNVRNFVKTRKPNWPAPVKLVGAGANGRVYELENGRMLKIIAGAAHQEYKSLNRLQGLRIAPEFRKGNSWAGYIDSATQNKMKNLFKNARRLDVFTMFIMGRVGGNATPITLWKYISNPAYKNQIKSNTPRIKARLKHLIEKMHERGVSHGDLHLNNILVTVSPSGYITGMWVIDFGRSKEFRTVHTESTISNVRIGETEKPVKSIFGNGKRSSTIPLYRRNGGPARLNLNMAQLLYNLNLNLGNLGTWRRRREATQREIQNLPNVPKPLGKSRSLTPRRKSPSPARARSATRWSPPRQRTPLRPLNLPARRRTPPKRGFLARLRSVVSRGRGRNALRTKR